MNQPGARRVAAIDCGTNSLRLLIADVDLQGGRLSDVQRRMEIVRLGQGVDATGWLAPEALSRTFAVLREYAAAIAESRAGAVRLVATSATRDAANAPEFSAGVTTILGVAPEVISGAQEAYLSFTGATAEFGARPAAVTGAGMLPARPAEPPFLVVDIGGGSTEFVLGMSAERPGGDGAGGQANDAAAGLAALSVDVGCVRLTERHLRADPPLPEQVAAATADIDAALSQVAARIDVPAARTLVGLAGSVTTVTAIALGLSSYDPARIHHARIGAGRVHEVTAELLGQTRRVRAAHRAIHPGRADVIAAGALILDRIMSRFGFAEVVASEHDILDGIAWSIVPGPEAGRGRP